MELAVVMAGGMQRNRAGQVLVPEKALQGMRAYVDRWPGEVRMVSRPADRSISGDIGADWRALDELPFAVDVVRDPVELVRRRGRTVVLAALTPQNAGFLTAADPVVFAVENTTRNQARYAIQSDPRPSRTNAVRIRLGSIRRRRRLVEMIRRSAGLQCNGWPAWGAYARHSPSPHLYLDSRARGATVRAAAALPSWTGDRPLRLAFSGRWVPPKGPTFLLDLARLLRRRSIEADVTFLGAGPLEAELRAAAPTGVSFAGSLPFDPDWVDHVTHRVDIMVLPHIQDDPSGTYLESLACGAPVLGFANAYLEALGHESGGVWAEPLRDVPRLADRVEQLLQTPSAYDTVRRRGLDFMREHCFEREFDGRVEHLLRAVSSSG